MSFQNNPCADPERGTGGIRLENHKAVGFFCNTGMGPRWSTGDLRPPPPPPPKITNNGSLCLLLCVVVVVVVVVVREKWYGSLHFPVLK